jgi:hypothetical protein
MRFFIIQTDEAVLGGVNIGTQHVTRYPRRLQGRTAERTTAAQPGLPREKLNNHFFIIQTR